MGAVSPRVPTLAALAALIVVTGVAVSPAQERRPDSQREDLIQLPGVTVTAPARLPDSALSIGAIPATVQTIDGEELRRSGARTLQDVLNRLPGATLNDEQGNTYQPGLSFRGFQSTPVAGAPQGLSVFFDGVRVNEPAVEEVNFDLIPLDDIERIEIVRGPTALFGRNTLGGAVNIISKRGGAEREIVPEISAGSFGHQKYRLRGSGAERGIDYYVSGIYSHEDGWRDGSESRLGRAFAKLGYKKAGTDITLSYQYAGNRIEQPGSLPLSELRRDRTLNFTRGDFFRPRSHLGILNLRQELTDDLSLALNVFGRGLSAEQFNANLIADNTRLFNRTTSGGGTVQLTHQASIGGRQNRLIGGVEYVHHVVNVTVFEEKNPRTLRACLDDAVEDGRDPAQACPLTRLSTKARDRQDAVGAFLQDTFELARSAIVAGDELILTVGARWDWLRHDIVDASPPASGRPRASGVSAFNRLNPRVGVNYNLSPRWGLYASYSQGFRAPAFLELTCASPGAICPGLQAGVAPDPLLKPVKAENYEVGLGTRPVPWLEGTLSLFRTDVIDDIFSISPTGTTGVFFQNIGDTRRQGLELALRATYKEWLDAYVNYAFTETTFQDQVVLTTPRLTAGCSVRPCTELVRRGSDLPLIPNHRVNAGVDYHATTWLTLSLGASYVGSQRLRGDEANVAPQLRDYVVVHAGIRARWRQLAGSVAIHNVLDREYETFGTFAPNAKLPGASVERFLTPAPPLGVTGTLSYRY